MHFSSLLWLLHVSHINPPSFYDHNCHIQWLPGALSLGVKRPGREADSSPPSSAEVKELVELYLHTLLIRLHGVVLSKAQGRIYLYIFTFNCQYWYITHISLPKFSLRLIYIHVRTTAYFVFFMQTRQQSLHTRRHHSSSVCHVFRSLQHYQLISPKNELPVMINRL
jgi:hypothetical protein